MIFVVQAIPGRETMSADTVWQLDGHGGGSFTDAPKVFHWTAPANQPPLFQLPPAWILVHDTKRDGHRRDLWRIMRDVVGNQDVALFEDDIQPCRNALQYIERWSRDTFTTFFNMMRLQGLHPIDDKRYFWGCQCIKIPARLVTKFVDAGDTDERPQLKNEGGDTRLGRLLMSWGEPIYHHRSLVQHVGAKSVGNPGARLVGIRAPAPDFDHKLDAMSLVGA